MKGQCLRMERAEVLGCSSIRRGDLTTVGCCGKRNLQIVATDRVEYYVEPTSGGETVDVGLDGLFAKVDRFVRARAVSEIPGGHRCNRGRDTRAGRLRELHSDMAHAADASMNQDMHRRGDLSALKSVPRRDRDEGSAAASCID